MSEYATPPIVVEQALRTAGIDWTPGERGGTFEAERCPLCPNGKPLGMQWLAGERGEEFVFTCQDGHGHLDVARALDLDPDDLPRKAPPPPALDVLPPPTEPMAVARELAARHYQLDDGTPTLRHWRGGWWQWRRSHWIELEERAVRAAAYNFTEHAVYMKDVVPEAWAPNRNRIANLLEALAATIHMPESLNQPTWIEGGGGGTIVACANGLLDVHARKLYEHTPLFFNLTAVPFDYDPEAPPPWVWFEFLNDLWGGDDESLNALQEWFGYVISGRLDLHKILLLVGPTRAGKGLIARILTALVGPDNVAGPTLSSLGGEFGLAPLLGKPLAVISDARLNGRNSSAVVERLLAISGEDSITVNRKYRDQWTGKLPARFVVISNELPQLGDASAAIAGRFVTLLLTKSWYGKEDTTLEARIRGELPGILNWALGGLARLEQRGSFTRPAATEEAYIALQDLSSPVGAFIRDRCELGHGEVLRRALDGVEVVGGGERPPGGYQAAPRP